MKLNDVGTLYDEFLDKIDHAESKDEVIDLIEEISLATSLSQKQFDKLIEAAVNKRDRMDAIEHNDEGDEIGDYLIEKESGEVGNLSYYEILAVNRDTGKENLIRKIKSFNENEDLKNRMKSIRSEITKIVGIDKSDRYAPVIVEVDYDSGEEIKRWVGQPDGSIKVTEKAPEKPSAKKEQPIKSETPPTPAAPIKQEAEAKQEEAEEINFDDAQDIAYDMVDSVIDYVYRIIDEHNKIQIVDTLKCELDSECNVRLSYSDGKINIALAVYVPDKYGKDFNLAVLDMMEPELNSEFNCSTIKKTFDASAKCGVLEVAN